ncbi:Cytochrome P450 monooygenase 3 [Colletotrichum trifolii]|uniref:Cytochrome P450 monooygenase 3 n=1 Tax=Colletotrichum trifolii TaxID=5466 RepID=A0A4R8R160_COLTR|nr:Cytochrome P450 monooygenase 3 [Colletotrichum trifolii]
MLLQLWAPVLLATVALAAYRLWRKLAFKLDFPVVGSPEDENMGYAIIEGYQKYPDTPFIVPSSPPRVILPMNLYQEVIQSDDSTFSFNAELYDIFLGKYTHIGEPSRDLINAVRIDVNRNLTSILQAIQDEAHHGMSQLVGDSTDFRAFNLYTTVLRMVGLMSGRVFVGLPLSRDEEWLAASINFTTDVAKSRLAMMNMKSWLRPFFLRFLPEVQHLLGEQKRAHNWMRPLVGDILQTSRDIDEKAVKPGSTGAFISWMMKYLPQEQRTAENVGNGQMVLSFAAIHTTSSTTTFALIDLFSRPEYILPLREEIERVIAEDGLVQTEDGRGYLSKQSLAKLKKLDSFIKESQRMSPLSYGGSVRRLRRDYTFSTGLKLPAGTPTSFPLWGVYNSPETEVYSPAYNADVGNAPPSEFDGFRFARLRDVPGRETRHQAATTGPDAFNFGHGPHACPGRFFAVYMVKCILVELLLNYDVKLKGAGDGEMQRPPNLVRQLLVMPNHETEVEIRRRFDA